MKLTHLGHACLLVETGTARLLLDPGTMSAFDDVRLLHPGDSFFVPDRDVDILAVAIDGPWLKLAEAVDYVAAVRPRVAVPIHEGETTDPGKYAGMLAAFAPAGVVRVLPPDQAVTL